jgi:hypothetical protein
MPSDLTTIFRDTLVGGLRRKAITTPSRWAEAYRVLGPPFPGKWSFEYHPWLRGMHDSKAQVNIGQKSAQMGFTEVVLNITFFNIDIKHHNVLYVLPNKTPDAGDFSSARFNAALELSPHIESLFSDTANVGHKRAGSANLYIRGSNSRSGLKSIPVNFIVLDELEEFMAANIPLVKERISGQLEWSMWEISTPTAPEIGINKEFLLSSQEHFCFKCPYCGKQTELVYPDCLVITAEHILDPKIKNSYYQCRECKHKLDKPTSEQTLQSGKGWELIKEAKWESFGDKNAENRGFYINQLYSPSVSPATIAAKVFAAETSNSEAEELWNSKIGLPFVPEGAQVSDLEIRDAIGLRRKCDPVPPGTLVVMGVDVGKWLHYEVAAYEFVKYGADLNMDAVCTVLTEGRCIDFSELGQLMRQWQIIMCVIDAQPERRAAYEFAMKFYGHVKTCFYGNSVKGKLISTSEDNDRPEITVDRTSWLDCALGRFHNKTITLPFDTRLEYKTHMKSLIRRHEIDSRGNPTGHYLSVGEDHLGHARCYCEIALPCAAALTTNEDIKVFL